MPLLLISAYCFYRRWCGYSVKMRKEFSNVARHRPVWISMLLWYLQTDGDKSLSTTI